MAKRVTIDSTGRLVIPKTIRERYGLHPGTTVEIAAEGERIVIEPVAEEAPLIERKGILIVTSELVGEPTDHHSAREERLDRLSGKTA